MAMAASELLFALRKFRHDNGMLNGMLVDLRRRKPIKTRSIAAEFFAHILRLEKGEEYNEHITKMLVNGRLVGKLVRGMLSDEGDIGLKRHAAEALSNLLVYGDDTDRHIVGEMGGRTALVEMIHAKNDHHLRTSAVNGILHNILYCIKCRQALRGTDLLERLADVLIEEVNSKSNDDCNNHQERLKQVTALLEHLIDGSPPSALRVFGYERLRKEVIGQINNGSDDMKIMLRGVLVKSVLWYRERQLLQEEGLMEALDKIKSIGSSDMTAEVQRAINIVLEACKN